MATKDQNKPRAVPKESEYKGFKVVFNDLKQRHIEKWRDLTTNDDKQDVPHANGNAVRSAFKAGWFELPVLSITEDMDPIADFPPDRVNWLARLIAEKYIEVMYVDPS